MRRYWPFLLAVAGERLSVECRRAANEEDVVAQAFWDFYRQLREGGWNQLAERHGLVGLLTTITRRKALNQAKYERATVRGGAVGGDSALGEARETVAADGPSPLEQVLQDEWCRHCLGRLSDDLRRVAEMLLAGRDKADIARELPCSQRTVTRKVSLLQTRWIDFMDQAERGG
jgi:DNA-directed RNA polymerase specialized sigma24 family protein